jgi:hypothetical protein
MYNYYELLSISVAKQKNQFTVGVWLKVKSILVILMHYALVVALMKAKINSLRWENGLMASMKGVWRIICHYDFN